MASPPPNPSAGEPSERPEEALASQAATQKTFVAPPASQLPSKLQFVALGAPGPSGIKQCFRTVKAARRVPTLPRRQEPAAPPARRRDRGKRHACSVCDKLFSSPGKLTQHVLSHTGELPFSCDLCDKRFNTKFKLVRHGLIHSEARAFACTVCGKTFNRKDHLNNHVRVHNPVKMLFTCERPDCRKSYTSPLSYRKHLALHSAEEGNLQCKICDETFTTRQEIVYHLKVHTGSRTIKNETDKKFTCNFCDRRFFTAKDVRRHLVVHTGRRDFLCPFCPQKFGRKDHLVRHVKNAHPEESWKSAAVGTSAEPVPEETAGPSRVQSFEETFSTDYTLDEFGMWEAPSPSSRDSASEGGPTRVPSSDIIVEMPPDLDIKVEPLDIKMEQPNSPCEYSVSTDYPVVYMVPATYPQQPPELPYMTTQTLSSDPMEAHLLDPAQSILLDPGEGSSGLSSQILRGLLEEGDGGYGQEARPQRLPAFTQAFQSAQAPRPPPQPPPQPPPPH